MQKCQVPPNELRDWEADLRRPLDVTQFRRMGVLANRDIQLESLALECLEELERKLPEELIAFLKNEIQALRDKHLEYLKRLQTVKQTVEQRLGTQAVDSGQEFLINSLSEIREKMGKSSEIEQKSLFQQGCLLADGLKINVEQVYSVKVNDESLTEFYEKAQKLHSGQLETIDPLFAKMVEYLRFFRRQSPSA